ncbi:MAG TPA: hypothetical protein VK971_03630 [Thiohalobacter sp.]|nr:hypothetical protein [Thiohalobacter sp.]
MDLYVNVYLVNRAHGGPEEGGWWFDNGEPVYSQLCRDAQSQEEVYAALSAQYERLNQGRHGIDSVLCEGVYVVYKETTFARPWPATRPRYA